MRKIIFSAIVTMSPLVPWAAVDDLQIGIGVNNDNLGELAQTSWEYAKASTSQKKFNDGFAQAFLRVSGSTDLYSLSASNTLYLTNFDTREVLGKWLLIRWEHEYLESEISARYGAVNQERNDEYHVYPGLGCYGKSPLRYGDVDANGTAELVLFLGNDFLIFSPQDEKIVFSASIAVDDWLSMEESEEYFRQYGGIGESNPQYQSSIAAGAVGNWQGGRFPGYRGYGKLYFGDFDNDESRDVVLWRKLYESHLRNEDERGFKKIDETLLHYRLIDGEYLPQETDSETIQGWLSSNNLRWPDGYPRLSECPGEEGELIAEMHDPLLNDPDVLPEQ